MFVWIFQEGHLQSSLGFKSNGAITSWMPLFLFVVLFGLSMDYHVFILTRIREAYDRGMPTDAAVAHGIKTTAGVVTSAAVVMVSVFAIFATLSLLVFKELGVDLGMAVLIDAPLIRAVLLPASMKLLGDRNWYLPRWLEWLPRVSPEGAGLPPLGEEKARPAPRLRLASRRRGRPRRPRRCVPSPASRWCSRVRSRARRCGGDAIPRRARTHSASGSSLRTRSSPARGCARSSSRGPASGFSRSVPARGTTRCRWRTGSAQTACSTSSTSSRRCSTTRCDARATGTSKHHADVRRRPEHALPRRYFRRGGARHRPRGDTRPGRHVARDGPRPQARRTCGER